MLDGSIDMLSGKQAGREAGEKAGWVGLTGEQGDESGAT